MNNDLYVTGAGVSADSGIPTFRGNDGFWTIGSKNYTPQEMATRKMFKEKPDEFLYWYYDRFVKYKDLKPNKVHLWLADKKVITQNIDCLDDKAGNLNYIPIHGRLDKVLTYDRQNIISDIKNAPWDYIDGIYKDQSNVELLKNSLLEVFKISRNTLKPQKGISLKPFVLLFDEYYTANYKINNAIELIKKADKIIFMGTSFNVNITSIALDYAIRNNTKIEVVDPNPVNLNIDNVLYRSMSAEEYVS